MAKSIVQCFGWGYLKRNQSALKVRLNDQLRYRRNFRSLKVRLRMIQRKYYGKDSESDSPIQLCWILFGLFFKGFADGGWGRQGHALSGKLCNTIKEKVSSFMSMVSGNLRNLFLQFSAISNLDINVISGRLLTERNSVHQRRSKMRTKWIKICPGIPWNKNIRAFQEKFKPTCIGTCIWKWLRSLRQ